MDSQQVPCLDWRNPRAVSHCQGASDGSKFRVAAGFFVEYMLNFCYVSQRHLLAMYKANPHKLFVALLWDSEGLGVFDLPAPIWPDNTNQVAIINEIEIAFLF